MFIYSLDIAEKKPIQTIRHSDMNLVAKTNLTKIFSSTFAYTPKLQKSHGKAQHNQTTMRNTKKWHTN